MIATGGRGRLRGATLLALLALLVNAGIAAADEVAVQRADYVVDAGGTFLSVEARADSAATALTLEWDSGPATAMGSGGSAPMAAVTDAGVAPAVYLHHALLVRVTTRPSQVRVTSAGGGSGERAVADWLGTPVPHPAGYQSGFTTHYLDPQEARQKVDDLAAEFPSLAQSYVLPESTNGYRRKAQWIFGVPYAGGTGSLSGGAADSAVIITSKADGHLGGNTISARFLAPGGANQALSTSLSGTQITVNFASDGAGAISSTAAQVTAALNAHPSISSMITASTYRGNAGTGIVAPTAEHALTDFLDAPAGVARGPFSAHALRIGKVRNGSQVGVLVFAQPEGRQLAAPNASLEFAEQLLRNYGTDPETTSLVDNLDIFVLPTLNPDGANYATYDAADTVRNMLGYCPAGGANDPLARDEWGVNLERNFQIGSIFDGYAGGSTSCTAHAFSGPFELSEPETRNLAWVAGTFANIRFAANLESNGGWLTWPPGAYHAAGRIPLPHPPPVTQDFLAQLAGHMITGVSRLRGAAILPQRVGTHIDVVGSEAGNPLDELYYAHGILGLDLLVGPARFTTAGTDLTEPGYRPAFATEGFYETIEAADGLIALLAGARAYAADTAAPVATAIQTDVPAPPSVEVTFTLSEPAQVYYTLDGSSPTTASSMWAPEGYRRPASAPIVITTPTTVRWIAIDLKGNTSSAQLLDVSVDAQPPVTGAVLAPVVNGFVRTPTLTLTATDSGGSGVASTEYRIDGGAFTPYSGPTVLTAAQGAHVLEYRSTDAAGNQEPTNTLPFNVDVTAPSVTITAPADGAVMRKGASVLAAYACSDAESGLASCAGPVASGTPLDTTTLGPHTFTVIATDGLGNQRTETRSYLVSNDVKPPVIRIDSPVHKARFARGQVVFADFECRDPGSGVATCVGSVADGQRLDTLTPGKHTFTVVATDNAGNRKTATRKYVVS